MSIYIQITSRCNMTCSHCCFACTARGHDMSEADFKSAIALAKEFDSHVCLGGGEPTLHPKFKEFLFHAIWELTGSGLGYDDGCSPIHMVTNGSNTEISLTLAKLARGGVITCAVSKDQYHDPIDPAVIRAFEKPKRDYYSSHSREDERDGRSINREPGFITPHGRAKEWGNHPYAKCNCDNVFITPKGNVFPCGCKVKSLGHISKRESLQIGYSHFEGHCQKSKEYRTEVLGEGKEPDITAAVGGEIVSVPAE